LSIFLNHGDLTGSLPVVVLGVLQGNSGANEHGHEDGAQISCQHAVVLAQSVNGDRAKVSTGNGDPHDKASDGAANGTGHGASCASFGPDQAGIDGKDGTTDGNAHELQSNWLPKRI
jgi:hypothetical protein